MIMKMDLSGEENNFENKDLTANNIHFCNYKELGRLLNGKYKPGSNDFILTDSNTHRYCLPVIDELFPELRTEQVVTILAGEQNKNAENLEFIWKTLLAGGAGRNSRLYCLGGGMVTDIGGFAAATFMRGIRFIHIPTSLIGMADASVGGKTAINLNGAKNVAGAFALPEAVLSCPVFLDTLPNDEFLSGFGEIVKISLVTGAAFWDKVRRTSVANLTGKRNDELAILISQAIKAKASIAFQDLKDTGVRQRLNFGHTIGHAMEELAFKKGNPVKHGFAVASGMICESYLSMKQAGLAADAHQTIESYLKENFPLIKLTTEDIPMVMSNLFHDKKKIEGNNRFSLLKSPGHCMHGIEINDSLIEESLQEYLHIHR